VRFFGFSSPFMLEQGGYHRFDVQIMLFQKCLQMRRGLTGEHGLQHEHQFLFLVDNCLSVWYSMQEWALRSFDAIICEPKMTKRNKTRSQIN
jgi:hypothetical protein